jgi:hypothetical protein
MDLYEIKHKLQRMMVKYVYNFIITFEIRIILNSYFSNANKQTSRITRQKGYILSRDSEVTLSHWSRSIEFVIMTLIDL